MSARPTDFRQGVPSPPRRRPSSCASYPHSPHLPVSPETSVGGIVVDVVDEIPYAVLIAQYNRAGRVEWCLPEGYLEAGEIPEQVTPREVVEETGIHKGTIRHLASIDYWFSGVDRRVYRTARRYLTDYKSGLVTVEHDPDHKAEEVAWIPLKGSFHRLAYPNEKRIVVIALGLLYRGL